MPFRWNYGGPAWATTMSDPSATPPARPMGAGSRQSGDHESTGTFRAMTAIAGPDSDGTRSETWA